MSDRPIIASTLVAHQDMSELELLIALRLRETEFSQHFGMSPADAQTAARVVRDVITELWRERDPAKRTEDGR